MKALDYRAEVRDCNLMAARLLAMAEVEPDVRRFRLLLLSSEEYSREVSKLSKLISTGEEL
ncbi:MAG: hypothetical protein ACUZ9M_00825 [Candidatus Scalindua sp.]